MSRVSSQLPVAPEAVDWQHAQPFSARYGDRYHTASGARAQAEHVFLGGCGLPAAWQAAADDAHPAEGGEWLILETGFGLGLNFLSTWASWRRCTERRPARLRFVSVEAHPVSADDIRRAARIDPALAALGEQLADAWLLRAGETADTRNTNAAEPLAPRPAPDGLSPEPDSERPQAQALRHIRLVFEAGQIVLEVLIGDARYCLEAHHARHGALGADSVFLDGFDPRKNPAIWDEATLRSVAAHCRAGTRLATWTVARPVRDALQALGFSLQALGFSLRKRPGLPPKRDCLSAVFGGAAADVVTAGRP